MKLVRHGEAVIAIIERAWEKAYLLAQQGKQEWANVYLIGQAQPFAEIHTTTRTVRLCETNQVAAEQGVVFHDLD